MEKGKTLEEQQYNFIKKTQEIIVQYDKLTLPESKEYDITLLLNASVGLLFIAQQKYNSSFTNIEHEPAFNNWPNILNNVSICRKYNKGTKRVENESITIKSVCRHIRNSIAHCNFGYVTNKADRVIEIVFDDYGHNDHTFHLQIAVEDFRNITTAISNFILKKIESVKKQKKQKK